MNLNFPAKITLICGLFLLVFVVFSSFDLAVSLSAGLYLIFFNKAPLPVFIISILLFVADVFYRSSEIHFRFISDLSIDAYILFLAAVIVYLKSKGTLSTLFPKLNSNESKAISKKIILPVLISVVFTMLFLPILGGYLAFLFGYIFYSYLNKQFNGKIAILIGLGFLSLAAVLVLIKNTLQAEEAANYAYFFLVVGTFQEIINLSIQRSFIGKKEKNNYTEKPSQDKTEDVSVQKIKSFNLPSFSFPKINLRITIFIIFLSLLSFLLYFSYPIVSKYKFSLSIPRINLRTPVPTSVPSPTVLPSPTSYITPTPISIVSTSAATLKILVLNGTEITGLAGSTSAKLKKMGFKNVETGNAKTSDYKTWEASLKKHDEDIEGILKNVLELETLTIKEATTGARFDIEIIAGERK